MSRAYTPRSATATTTQSRQRVVVRARAPSPPIPHDRGLGQVAVVVGRQRWSTMTTATTPRGALASATLSLTFPSRRWVSGTSSRPRRRDRRGRRSSPPRDRARPAARRALDDDDNDSRDTVHRQRSRLTYVISVSTRCTDHRCSATRTADTMSDTARSRLVDLFSSLRFQVCQ